MCDIKECNLSALIDYGNVRKLIRDRSWVQFEFMYSLIHQFSYNDLIDHFLERRFK